jgi:hypothetical protein
MKHLKVEGMRQKVLIALTSIVFCGAGAFANAHHSFGATYDTRREIAIEGKLVQFMFRNPHSFVHVEAADDTGALHRWSIEWSGTIALTRQGVDRGTLRVGDEVIITAHPSRSPGEFRGQMLTLNRPVDGLNWGTRPFEVVD